MKTSNYIGKQYKPFDNSWQVNLTNQTDSNGRLRCDYIAGLHNEPSKMCTIIANPFEIKVNWMQKDLTRTFVIVTDPDGNAHFTLFNETGLVKPKTDKLQYIIDKLKRLQDELS
jgi:hypothetical protein